jgi:SAM-dependent methyltransferase
VGRAGCVLYRAPVSVAEYYERYWSEEGFNPIRPVPDRLAKLLTTYLPEHGSCLDVGCGDGRSIGLLLRGSVGSYLGVDVSDTAVARTRELGLQAERIADAAELPFEDGAFDAVVCLEVLEHLFAPDRAVAEGLRVLRPGGTYIATVPNVAYWRWRRDLALRGTWNPFGDEDSVDAPWRDPHIRFFTVGAFERMLARAGFASVEVGGHEGEILGTWRLSGVARAHPQTRRRLYQALDAALLPLLALRLHAVARKAA